MHRRHLLGALAAAAGGTLIGCRESSSGGAASAAPRAQLPVAADVVVIGAGMAGLAAARQLHDLGIKVTVVEARDRVGGRVFTDRSQPDAPLDLGASWIHGTANNPLHALAKRAGEKTVTTGERSVIYDATGKRLPSADADRVARDFASIMGAARKVGSKLGDGADASLGGTLREAMSARGLSAEDRRRMETMIRGELEQDFAIDVDDISLRDFDSGADDDRDEVVFPNGYDRLATWLANGLDVRLGTAVEQVDVTPARAVVQTRRGVFEAQRVIVTLPLGVLQSGAVAFSPALPTAKRDAIGRMRMGVLDKVWLRFAQPFWSTTDGDADLIRHVAERDWAVAYNFSKYTGHGDLLFFVAGSSARALEGRADDEITRDAMRVLRRAYPRAPDPSSRIVTRWAADPFSLGSYSAPAVGTRLADYDELAAPVGDRLFFAGEATVRDVPATVTGAYQSGMREARRVAASLGKAAVAAPDASSGARRKRR